ncbi:TonB-dependent receptor [Granulicella sp. dw_53]|uniref:TonB-dependent receptor n=1 Tax=Granulicella sp. dw_53 TaxID=2719792 RepID=UPI002103872B|nr:TonB-dependent receptor [Granulicella sp. dw_53]
MKKQRMLAMFSICCVVLVLGLGLVQAQTVTGSVRGVVTDPTGAVVFGAKVAIKNVDTEVVTSTTTGRAGLYSVSFLTIGNYTVTITAPGFGSTSAGPFVLQIDQIAKVDLQLQIGSAESTVEVAANVSPILNTENATLGTSISSNTLESMPLNGLNVTYAAMFVPGAVNPTAASMGGLEGSYRNTSQDGVPSFSGNRKQGNNFVLDGIEINETIANTSGYNPSPYSLQEMRIITGNADAEYGNVNGGEVIMVTKSGTNRFHGNAFEYFKNQDLSANSWGNNYSGVAKGRFTQNQFGGSIGGPIFKDKLFFFADYEGLRYNIPPSESLSSVPDALERAGDFSELLSIEGIQLYNTSNGTGAATPYPNNRLPAINNPVARYLFAHPAALPLPNHAPLANTVTQRNYLGFVASRNVNNQVDGRIDYTINHSDTLMVKGSYGDAHDEQTQVPLPINFPMKNDYPFYMGVVDWIHTFSPSIVNEVRVGYSRVVQSVGNVTDPSGLFGRNGNATVGIPFASQPIVGFSLMSIGNSDNSTFGVLNSAGQIAVDNNFSYGDSLTWVHGHHITKGGVQLVRYQQNYFNPSNLGGLLGGFSYTGAYTSPNGGASGGDGYADFELNAAQSASVSGQSGPFGQRQWRDAVYVQDDWKILPNLTLNIGLRYAYDQPNYEVNDKMVSVDLQKAYFAPVTTPIASLLRFAGKDGNSRALVNPYYGQVMPRVGFALQVDPRAVLRGGYSITNAMEGTGNGLRMTQNAPFLTSFTSNATTPSPTSGGGPLRVENGFASATPTPGNGTQYDVWDPNFRSSSVQQFNLTAQFMVASKTTAQMSYVGELGQHLAVPVLINQYIAPVPASCPGDTSGSGCVALVAPYYSLVGGNSQIVETTSRGNEKYHALQTTLHQQETNGLEFTFNYTWSKSMTNSPGGFFGVNGVIGGYSFWQNAYDPRADYGRSNFDVPNNFSGTVVYNLPIGRGKRFGGSWNWVTDEALGGWELAANALFASGFPINIYQNSNDNLNTAADSFNYNGVSRVNQYFKPRLINRSPAHWFGTDASAVPCTTAGSKVNSLGAACAFGLTSFNQFGNSQNNTERAPGSRNIDLSLFKAFRTKGEQVIKFRVDAFNAFNMVSLAAPRSRVGSSTYGVITSALSAPRQFQFSAVYQF